MTPAPVADEIASHTIQARRVRSGGRGLWVFDDEGRGLQNVFVGFDLSEYIDAQLEKIFSDADRAELVIGTVNFEGAMLELKRNWRPDGNEEQGCSYSAGALELHLPGEILTEYAGGLPWPDAIYLTVRVS